MNEIIEILLGAGLYAIGHVWRSYQTHHPNNRPSSKTWWGWP